MNIEILDLAAEVRRKMVVVFSLQLENTSPFICLIGVMVAKLYNWPCRQVHNPLSQSFLCRGSMMRRWRADSMIISSFSYLY